MKFLRIIDKNSSVYGWIDMVVMTLLTIMSVYDGKSTVFYIIYLFWWNEVLSILINTFFDKLYKRPKQPKEFSAGSPAGILLTVYWLFIIIIFGLITNWSNTNVLWANFEIMFFKNIYFNLNLLFIITEISFFNIQYKNSLPAQASSGITANMIILHISIILGAFLLFLVVKKFPNVFTPENTWASLLIISPFLLLRFLVQLYKLKSNR